jgi:hypothetical protein
VEYKCSSKFHLVQKVLNFVKLECFSLVSKIINIYFFRNIKNYLLKLEKKMSEKNI